MEGTSIGALCVPQVSVGHFPHGFRAVAGGGGLEARVPGLPTQGRWPGTRVDSPGLVSHRPTSIQILPGQAMRPQGSGFSDWTLAASGW